MNPSFCNFSEVKVCKGCISYKVFKNFQKSYQFFQTNWEWLYQPSRLIFSSHGYCNVINLTSFECFQDKDSKCIFIEKLIFFDLIPSKKSNFFPRKSLNLRKFKGNWNSFPIYSLWLGYTEQNDFYQQKRAWWRKKPLSYVPNKIVLWMLCYWKQQGTRTWNICFFILQLCFKCIWILHHLWYEDTMQRHFLG